MTMDMGVLTADEVDEYKRLLAAKAALPEKYDATSWRLPGRVWGVTAAWFVTWGGSLALIAWWAVASAVPGASGGVKLNMGIVIFGLVVLVGGGALIVAWLVNDPKRIQTDLDAAQSTIDEFLKRIDYEKRVERHGDYDDGMTLRQHQHAWYGTHSELNWTHRVQGEALGFDSADSYVNNFLESE